MSMQPGPFNNQPWQKPPYVNQPWHQPPYSYQPWVQPPNFRQPRSGFGQLENILLLLIGLNWLSKRTVEKKRRPLLAQGNSIAITVVDFTILDYSTLRVFLSATNHGDLNGERDFEIFIDAQIDGHSTGDGRMKGTIRLAAHERTNQYLDVFVSNSQAVNVRLLNQVSLVLDTERSSK